MHIEELKESGGRGEGEEELVESDCCKEIVVSDAKRALVGAGARLLFYPTLLYNVLRNMIQAEFRWWDAIDEFILLGAVPFPTDVPRLKQLGVGGVVTMNESYETLVSTSLYHAHGIDHLVLPTRDYLFAPSYGDICQAVDFIHNNISNGKKTYVHCKAGRGRSTTIVLCYLVQHRQMTPKVAYKYARSIRSRVLLAPAQWQAVQQFYFLRVKGARRVEWTPRQVDKLDLSTATSSVSHDSKDTVDDSVVTLTNLNPSHFVLRNYGLASMREAEAFDESSVVVITESDLVGYDDSNDSNIVGNEIRAVEMSIAYKVQFVSQAALARLSGLRPRFTTPQKISGETICSKSSCSVGGTDKFGGIGVDIHVY